MTVAARLTDRLAAASEERGDYLDPNLAALVEALFWSRNAPAGTRDIPLLPGMETAGQEEDGLLGKPLCASVAGFSLHAAQFVRARPGGPGAPDALWPACSVRAGTSGPPPRREGDLPPAPSVAERTGSHRPRSRAARLSPPPGGAGLVPIFPPGAPPWGLCQSQSVSEASSGAATSPGSPGRRGHRRSAGGERREHRPHRKERRSLPGVAPPASLGPASTPGAFDRRPGVSQVLHTRPARLHGCAGVSHRSRGRRQNSAPSASPHLCACRHQGQVIVPGPRVRPSRGTSRLEAGWRRRGRVRPPKRARRMGVLHPAAAVGEQRADRGARPIVVAGGLPVRKPSVSADQPAASRRARSGGRGRMCAGSGVTPGFRGQDWSLADTNGGQCFWRSAP